MVHIHQPAECMLFGVSGLFFFFFFLFLLLLLLLGSRRPLCERWRRSSSGLLMAQGKILLGGGPACAGLRTLEDCLKIRSTGVDNEDCA